MINEEIIVEEGFWDHFFLAILVIILMIIFWPLVLVFAIFNYFDDKRSRDEIEEDRRINRGNLIFVDAEIEEEYKKFQKKRKARKKRK